MTCAHVARIAGVCLICPPLRAERNPPTLGNTLTREDAEHMLARVRAVKARARLADFVRYSWGVLEPGAPPEWGWHIEAIADHVQWQLEDRAATDTPRAQNLLVNIPPRCLKSRIISVCATAWAWIHWPSMRIVCLSTNPRVSQRDADATRLLIRSAWYQEAFAPAWKIRDDRDAISSFANTAGGQRDARGFTSQIVGEGADWIIIDDPNDAQDVHSQVQRAGVNDRWDSSIANRVNSPERSIRTGVMQRVHQDDWSGHVLAQGGWAHLCLPMEYDPDRPCRTVYGWSDPRTVPGTVLHPRFTPAFLASEKRRLGSYGYAGQMQQRPSPAEGGMFQRKWWRFWKPDGQAAGNHPRPLGSSDAPAVTLPKSLDWMAISVDCSFKATTTGSAVGLQVIAGKGADRYILTDKTRPMTFTETVAAIRALRVEYPMATRVLVEDKANGTAVIDTLRSEISGLIPINPEGGKESRAAAIQPAVEAGNVYLADGAPWVDAFLEELSTFPNGSHDDRVDTLSQCLIHMGTTPDMAHALKLCSL